MKPQSYVCAHCQGEFEYDSEWSDQGVIDEYNKVFPECPDEPKAAICDNCFKMFIAKMLIAAKH